MEENPETGDPPSYDEATGSEPSTSYLNDGFELNAIRAVLSASTQLTSFKVRFPPLTEADLKEACLEYISSHCCYGSKFIRNWFLVSIENGYTFHYQLQSFGEKRESTEKCEGYDGQNLDGPQTGPIPDMWDIPLFPPQQFRDYQTKTEIPYSTYITRCSDCSGMGSSTCSSCNGGVGEICWRCRGSGRNDKKNVICVGCSGSGFEKCLRCNGSGRSLCSRCDGYGRLRHYRMLIVTWKNHTNDFISASLNLPKDLIKQANGSMVFEEENGKVRPVTICPDAKINSASQILISKHSNSFRDELIRKQRHVIRAIPVTRAFYKWKSSEGEFYVYGLEKKVYFDNYPQQFRCCTCL